ncbi:hypothetical protein AALA98_02680 [Lachnospiraceae bacterium 45-W7]
MKNCCKDKLHVKKERFRQLPGKNRQGFELKSIKETAVLPGEMMRYANERYFVLDGMAQEYAKMRK